MHDLSWERWLDEAAQAAFTAVYRPELPAPERLRAAAAWHAAVERLAASGAGARGYLRDETVSSDTQRRSAAARILADRGEPDDVDVLLGGYLDPERPWLAPRSLLLAARRHPLDPGLIRHLPEVGPALRSTLVRALLAHDRPEARVLLERLVTGAWPTLAQAGLEEAARWGRPDVLRAVLLRVDGTDEHPPALVPAAITAAAHLALEGVEHAIDWLEERTGDEDPGVAGLAHAALADLGWPGCLVDLEALLDEADGEALAYALDAADGLAESSLVPALVRVIRRTRHQSGAALDDNPADHAIRILERLTGRWVSVELCTYDRHGNLDAATRQRAVLLFEAIGAELPRGRRVRGGRPLGLGDLVEDLLGSHPGRTRRAAWQLRAATGDDLGLEPRGDLLANLEAVQAWRARARRPADGTFRFQARTIASPYAR